MLRKFLRNEDDYRTPCLVIKMPQRHRSQAQTFAEKIAQLRSNLTTSEEVSKDDGTKVNIYKMRPKPTEDEEWEERGRKSHSFLESLVKQLKNNGREKYHSDSGLQESPKLSPARTPQK